MNDESRNNQESRLKKIKFKKGIYVLPNLLTTASLFMGFYSIVASIQEKFFWAAVAIFASLVFDGLDGRVARITNSTSKFELEYDSLSISSLRRRPLFSVCLGNVVLWKAWLMAGFSFVACGL